MNILNTHDAKAALLSEFEAEDRSDDLLENAIKAAEATRAEFLAAQAAEDAKDKALIVAKDFARISKMYITSGTRKAYNMSNRLLLVWLHANEPQCLSDYVKLILDAAADLKVAALAIAEKADKDNIPIIVKLFTTKMFSRFLYHRAYVNGGAKYLSKSANGSFRSAYKELLRQCEIPPNAVWEKKLGQIFKGFLRAHAEEKGKDPMPFLLFTFLCQKMIENGTSTDIFSHAFLTLTWNLMCRSKNSVYIHRNHVSGGFDCLAIWFAHTKTDI